jgi:hypothetical protein
VATEGKILKNKKPAPKGNGLIVVEDFAVIFAIFIFMLFIPYQTISNNQDIFSEIFSTP